ncbi:MAG TPA: hypothetical protein VGE97_08215 [Nitrososphaera sp.]
MGVKLGDPRDSESMGAKYQTTAGKATGASSAIAVGKLVKITESTGLAALATAGDAGPFGVTPTMYPASTDSDPQVHIARGAGAEYYLETTSVLKQHQEVVADTDGKVKAKAAEADGLVVGEYMGKEGEGRSLGKPITDAAATNIVCIRFKKGAA